MTDNQVHLLLVYTAIVSFAVLIQAVALFAIAMAVRKLLTNVTELAGEAKGKVYPIMELVSKVTLRTESILARTEGLLADVEPKVKRVTSNIADTSDIYRAKVAEIDAFVSDATRKAKRQSDRVDGMVTDVLTRTAELKDQVQHAILMPVRQMTGIVGALRAGIENLMHAETKRTPKPVAFEGDSIRTGLEDDYHA